MPGSWDTPPPLMITHTSELVIHIKSQVKRRQSQSYKFQKFKYWNFARNITCDTPSEVVW